MELALYCKVEGILMCAACQQEGGHSKDHGDQIIGVPELTQELNSNIESMKLRIDEEREKIKKISADLIATIRATEKEMLSLLKESQNAMNSIQK